MKAEVILDDSPRGKVAPPQGSDTPAAHRKAPGRRNADPALDLRPEFARNYFKSGIGAESGDGESEDEKRQYGGVSNPAESFKDQHFRAIFSISTVLADLSELRKMANHSYAIERRRYWSPCLAASQGVNLLCLASEAYGAAARALSETEKARLRNFVGTLGDFDDQGLRGINAKLVRNS